MAIDQALLDLADAEGTTTLRLYRWDPFCLSFGRHEPASRRYPRARVEGAGIDVVRRPTGGRAVWHARELTWAVAAPLGPRTLPEHYHELHATVLEAVRALGADAALAPAPGHVPGPGAGACFDAPVGGEIVIGGRKVAGSAQVRQNQAFLQHGALLLEDDQSPVRDLAGVSREHSPELPLAAALGRPVPFAEAAEAVIGAFAAATWPVANAAAVLARAERHVPRFQSPEWTWER